MGMLGSMGGRRRGLAPWWGLWGALVGLGCEVPYLAVQGRYQLSLLRGREPIDEVLTRPDLAEGRREALALVDEVRRFAASGVGLDPTGNYTTVNLSWDRTIYNVTACAPLAFEPHTWWFPIVGRVPYKGFFRHEDAQRQASSLEALGLEVALREVAGYSTLGFFSDPILPDMLDYPPAGLIDLILHELTHATVYFKGQVDFNESLASFVAHRGSLAFLEAHSGEGVPTVEEAEDRYADRSTSQAFLRDLYERLSAVYEADVPDSEKARQKAALMEDAAARYRELPFRTPSWRGRDLGEINNADLMSFRRYHSGEEGFDDLLRAVGGELPAFMQAIKSLQGHPSPLDGVTELSRSLKNNPSVSSP